MYFRATEKRMEFIRLTAGLAGWQEHAQSLAAHAPEEGPRLGAAGLVPVIPDSEAMKICLHSMMRREAILVDRAPRMYLLHCQQLGDLVEGSSEGVRAKAWLPLIELTYRYRHSR